MKSGLFVKNCSTSVGNNEFEETAFVEVYPNPGKEILNIELLEWNTCSIMVYNHSGRMLKECKISDRLNLHHVAKTSYL